MAIGGWVVCVATSHELRPLREPLGLRLIAPAPYPLFEGCRNGQQIAVLQTGVGPHRARLAVAWLLANRPWLGILSVGLSGGLQASLASGSVVIGNQWICLEGQPPLRRAVGSPGERRLLERAVQAATDGGLAVHQGTLLTMDRVVVGVEEKRRLAVQTGAAAVDMESGAIAEAALAAAVEPVAVRVIFDGADEPLDVAPDRFLRPDGSVSIWQCGLAVAARPSLLPTLWLLGRRSTRAMTLAAHCLCRFFDGLAAPAS